MRRQAWQFLATAALVFGCNTTKPSGDPFEDVTCSNKTKCPGGYKCDNNQADPQSTGKCVYQECELTVPCKTSMTCLADKESAVCDKKDITKFCSCMTPTSEDVPVTPTTGGDPTTGKP